MEGQRKESVNFEGKIMGISHYEQSKHRLKKPWTEPQDPWEEV